MNFQKQRENAVDS